jgi:propanediol dehydratase small subunit
MYVFLIATGIAIVFAVIGTIFERRRLRAYWDRVCTGARWRRRFPQATKDEIRKFLNVFVDAFGFRKSRRLSFSPDDKIMDVYRALYPPKWSIGD